MYSNLPVLFTWASCLSTFCKVLLYYILAILQGVDTSHVQEHATLRDRVALLQQSLLDVRQDRDSEAQRNSSLQTQLGAFQDQIRMLQSNCSKATLHTQVPAVMAPPAACLLASISIHFWSSIPTTCTTHVCQPTVICVPPSHDGTKQVCLTGAS